MYNVLWLDDEYEKFETFEALAEYQGLKLNPFGLRQDGINELHLHPTFYDAILLDAKMPEKSANEVKSIKGVKDVINLAHELHIPVYISTGQPDLQKDSTFKDSFDNVFVKGDATDMFGGDTELFAKMLSDLEQTEKSALLRQYADVITALQGLGKEKEGLDILLPIWSALQYPDNHKDFVAKKHYNQLRILIEHIFRAFNAKGILPDAFIPEGKVNLANSFYALNGQKPQHICWTREGAIIPRHIAGAMGSILFQGNTYSHSTIAADGQVSKDYLLFGNALLMCNAIIWANEYVKEHNDIETNKSEWIRFEPQIEQTTT